MILLYHTIQYDSALYDALLKKYYTTSFDALLYHDICIVSYHEAV